MVGSQQEEGDQLSGESSDLHPVSCEGPQPAAKSQGHFTSSQDSSNRDQPVLPRWSGSHREATASGFFLPSLPGFFCCSHGWGSLYPAPEIRRQERWAFGESAVSGAVTFLLPCEWYDGRDVIGGPEARRLRAGLWEVG